jgi:parvulin-like peptidyl-prolyl isomerase
MNETCQKNIQSEEIVNYLKSEMALKEVYQKIFFQKVIHDVAQEKGITVSTEEIEAEASRQRRQMGLEKAADTLAWLAQQLASPDDWEVGIRNRLLGQKLARALFTEEVQKFFVQNRFQFDQVLLYQIIVENEKLAQELYYQIEEGEISFYDAAHLYDMDERRRYKCGFEGKVDRWAISPDIAAIVFSSPPKQLLGPIKTDLGYHLCLVEELIPAELTEYRYEQILTNMFQEWLAARLDSFVD